MADVDVDINCGCNHLRSQHRQPGLGCSECRCPHWHVTPQLATVDINDRWPLILPEHRAFRSSWPWFEAARLSAMHHHLGPGETIYDVGAEEGDFSTLFASWGCDVVLVEPNPKAWPCIRASFEANGLEDHVVGWWAGLLGDAAVAVGVWEAWVAGWPASARDPVVPDHGYQDLSGNSGSTSTWTLDELVEYTARPPTAITIDVEGGELFVLRGALETLRQHRPKVWVSVHPSFLRDLYGHDPVDIQDLMGGLDYDATFLATDHEEHWMFLPA